MGMGMRIAFILLLTKSTNKSKIMRNLQREDKIIPQKISVFNGRFKLFPVFTPPSSLSLSLAKSRYYDQHMMFYSKLLIHSQPNMTAVGSMKRPAINRKRWTMKRNPSVAIKILTQTQTFIGCAVVVHPPIKRHLI